MCFWQKFLENAIDDLKNKGYNFNHLAEINIITIVNKMDMSHDFYITHKMCSLYWKLNKKLSKNPKLTNNLNPY